MYESLVVLTLLINIAGDFVDRAAANKADAYSLALWTTIVQFLLIVPLIGLVQEMPWPAIIVSAIVGAASALGRIPWYRALARGESLSRLSPFRRMSSVIVLIAAFLLLGEDFTWQKGLGGSLMILGAILMGFEKPMENLRYFIENNRGAGLVLIFAASSALITIMYKYLLNAGMAILSIYFFLKLFQMLSMVGHSLHNGTLFGSHGGITRFRLFVVGRMLQTVAALIYLLALQNLDLSIVQPIAATTPLLLFAIEWALAWLGRHGVNVGYSQEVIENRARVTRIRFASIAIVSAGILFLQMK